MRTNLLILGIVASLTAGNALAAENASREESVGVGTGAIVGAVAGGPVGAVLGAAIGAKIGDSFHRRGEKVDSLGTELRGSRATVKRLQKDIAVLAKNNDSLDAELAELRTMSRPELVSLLQAGIEMDLLFRTDEHVLNDTTRERLKALAAGLSSMHDVYIRLDGFADERGAADYNQKLSQRRADFVRDVLVDSGVPEQRIRINAHGESDSTDDSVDSYALERKVSLTLFVEESPSLAANPAN